jgi:hypothetical protein
MRNVLTGGPITIAIDELDIFEIGTAQRTPDGFTKNVEPVAALAPELCPLRMPILSFFWTCGARVDFSLS